MGDVHPEVLPVGTSTSLITVGWYLGWWNGTGAVRYGRGEGDGDDGASQATKPNRPLITVEDGGVNVDVDAYLTAQVARMKLTASRSRGTR